LILTRLQKRLSSPLLAALLVSAPSAPLVDSFDAAWRIVRDTHFDPAFNGVDWQRVRDELRPRALAATTHDELRAVVREMLDRLGQSHFVLLPVDTGLAQDGADLSGSPGLDVRVVAEHTGGAAEVVVVSVDPDGPAARAGVRAGWAISAIDERPVADLVQPIAKTLEPRLARVTAWTALNARLRGAARSRMELALVDERGREVHATVVREPARGERVQVGHIHLVVETSQRTVLTPRGKRVGVIAFSAWMTSVDGFVARAIDEFRGLDAIVLDLRGNPGGLAAMIMGISGYFLSEAVPLGVMKTRDGELRFVANPRRVSAAGIPVQPYAGPVAILIDDMTGSASECFTAGMQAIGRARVFGRRSMGQALPALFDRLPNGDVLLHAFGDFVTPAGVRVEGRGVVPDEEAPLARQALAAGRDEALDAALRWVDRAPLRAQMGSDRLKGPAQFFFNPARSLPRGR
jgi:carboxyl-terminal processing protease